MDLPWIVLFTPLVSAFLIGVFTKRLHNISAGISILAVLISLGASIGVFLQPDAAAGSLSLPWLSAGDFQVNIGLKIDQLSKAMMLIVTIVGTLVHLYSFAYMAGDDGKGRFFGGLSLFMFSMLGIVFADNFVMMFIFWELVGVSSYLLIGHWYNRKAPPAAANKAFLANRVGDFGFMLGILLVWLATKAINFDAIQGSIDLLKANPGYATLAALAVFCGAVGKSAQFPLHVWLPDAMEGPTPVSALIHAATMVTAGVFMVARLSSLFELAPNAQAFVTLIGATTALFAATIGLVQNDIKRIIAYSTCSQLGYMFVAMGVGAYSIGMFHLFTHAFFKALLFLGSGSVIHAMHHEQDIRHMGGLKDRIPFTYAVMLVGTLALTGFPLTAGYYSKDAIIEAAFVGNNPMALYAFLCTVAAAALTSFYSWRLVFKTFHGKPHDQHHYEAAHESPLVMTIPLAVLAVGSLVAGFPFKEVFAGHGVGEFFRNSLTFAKDNNILDAIHHVPLHIALLPTVMMVLGFLIAWQFYIRRPDIPVELARQHDGLYRFLLNKWYFDELYDLIFVRPAKWLGRVFWKQGDGWLIDGFGPDGVSARVLDVTRNVVRLQTGYLYHYAFAMLIGVAAFITWFMFAPGSH